MIKVSPRDNSNTKSIIDKNKTSNDENSGFPNMSTRAHDKKLSDKVTDTLKQFCTLKEKL